MLTDRDGNVEPTVTYIKFTEVGFTVNCSTFPKAEVNSNKRITIIFISEIRLTKRNMNIYSSF